MASTINASNSGFGGIVSTGDSSGVLQLQTASTTAVTIDASQNVGIGTTSPASKLDVTATSADAVSSLTVSGVQRWQFKTLLASGNFSIYDATGSATRMVIDTGGNVLIGQTTNTQNGRLAIAGSGGSADDLVFNTTSTYSEIQAYNNKPLILNRQGNNVLVGTSSSVSSSNAGVSLSNPTAAAPRISVGSTTSLYTALGFTNGNGNVGAINTTGSSTQYATSSDYRLKENIAPMIGALARVALLKPVTYSWKSDGITGEGFIAHELQEVIPDCVSGEKDAVDADGKPIYQGIDTSFLVATLTAAIKELKEIVDAQAERIKALEAK